jgi:hypothetical protein
VKYVVEMGFKHSAVVRKGYIYKHTDSKMIS